jgi:membrane-associated phospholipid phosphatase
MATHPGRWASIGISAVLGVLVAAFLMKQTGGLPVGPDAAWESVMRSHLWGPAVVVAGLLATLGNSAMAAATTAVVAILLIVIVRRRRTAVALVVSVALGALASTSFKLIAERPRPGDGLATLSSFSFPSGHTTWAAAFAVSLAFGLPRLWTWLVAGAWIAFMAWSRTYLGVHWLSDVAGGAVLGSGIALLVELLLVRLGARMSWLRSSSRVSERSGFSESSRAMLDA